MKIKSSFSRADARTFRSEIETALLSVAKKYGVNLEIGRITYGFQLAAKVIFKTESSVKREETISNTELQHHSLMIGNIIRHNGETLKIVGFNSRARKNTIQLESLTSGKKYSASPAFCILYLVKNN